MTPDNSWKIVTLSSPVLWQRDTDETWFLNPRIKYIVQGKHCEHLKEHIDTVSELVPGDKYRPLDGNINLSNKKILLERGRDCGTGDHLFMTGPLAYLQHVTGHTVEIDMYGLNERSQVMDNNPALKHLSALRGPLLHDALGYYDYHWLLPSVTEFNEEPDQINVYDAIFSSIGIDYNEVDPRWKRPYLYLTDEDRVNFDTFLFFLWNKTKTDFRRAGYYVVAPHCFSSLRTADYGFWLNLIQKMAEVRPVIIIGSNGPSASTSMTYSDFLSRAGEIANVVSLVGVTPVKTMMSLLKNAVALVSLDTAPLYIAQAFQTPAVSLWGTHDPKSRLRYDRTYLANAIWTKECPSSPCYLYRGFNSKCPAGSNQKVCENLLAIQPETVMDCLNVIEKDRKG